MEKVFEAKQRLMDALGWSENPFVKDLRLENREDFLKYYCPLESATILKKLAFDTKACILMGPKGVGKTSALYFIMYSLPQEEFVAFVLRQPPESLSELALEIGIGERGIISRIKSFFSGRKAKGLSRLQIAQRVRDLNRKAVFFLDEAHLLSNKEMYMEFKYLLDEVPNLRLVLCALGKEAFPDSLLQLVGEGNVFTRNKFTEKEMREIVEHRISAVGGSGTDPFDGEFLRRVFSEQNLLTPRYVFDELNNYLADLALDEGRMRGLQQKAGMVSGKTGQVEGAETVAGQARPRIVQAAEKGYSGRAALGEKYAHDPLVSAVIAEGGPRRVQQGTAEDATADEDEIIDGDNAANEAVYERLAGPRPSHAAPKSLDFLTTMHAQWWVQLSPSQQQIMNLLLSSGGGMTLAQIMERTKLTQNTAFNALYQLRGDDSAEIARKPEVPFPLVSVRKQSVGSKKRNIYSANEKIRNLFTMT